MTGVEEAIVELFRSPEKQSRKMLQKVAVGRDELEARDVNRCESSGLDCRQDLADVVERFL